MLLVIAVAYTLYIWRRRRPRQGGNTTTKTHKTLVEQSNTSVMLCFSLTYHYITVPLYYSTTILLYYSSTILLYYSATILLYYSATILLYCYTTLLLHYYTTLLLPYYPTTLLYYCTTVLRSGDDPARDRAPSVDSDPQGSVCGI